MPPIQPFSLEVSVLVVGMTLLLVEAFATKLDRRQFAWGAMVSLGIVFILSFFCNSIPAAGAYSPADSLYVADPLAMFFKRIALLTTIGVLIMGVEFIPVVKRYTFGATPQSGIGEFFAIPVITCAGLMWMASAADFVMIFVSLELVTISFYILVSYLRRSAVSLEAGVKYLILGALSTGFLVYGITWIYGMTGQTSLKAIGVIIANDNVPSIPLLFGFALVIVSLGFKVAAVPFQIWIPDVYQGAPTPVTAFLSVGSKAAGFVVLIRVIEPFLQSPTLAPKIGALLVILAAATLIFGNLAALPQNNLKRLLAYSSVAHAGFLLTAVASSYGPSTTPVYQGTAISFYLFAYVLMTILAFLIMLVVSTQSDSDDMSVFNGLGQRSPYLAFGMLVSMMSLAGVPLTAGFFGKFLVFKVAMQQHHFVLVGIAVLAAGCGFYYYLKVVRAMYWQTAENTSAILVTPLTKATVAVLVVLIFLLGIYPEPVMRYLY